MKISIVTTTYNRKDFLREAIESVQKSILAPLQDVSFEHIVYDDGSDDATHTIFPNKEWKNVFYYRADHNEGVAAAKAAAVTKTTGDYVYILDSDDVMVGRAIYNFASEAIKHPSTRWFVSDFLRVDDTLRYLVGEDYYGWNFRNPQEVRDAIIKGEHFIQGNVFFTKELYGEVGGFNTDLSIAEDVDLYIRFLSAGHMPQYVSFISHLHRFHAGNLSKNETLAAHVARMKRYI